MRPRRLNREISCCQLAENSTRWLFDSKQQALDGASGGSLDMKFDRTTKTLLTVIAVCLSILVVRPFLKATPEAVAQSTFDPDFVTLGYRVADPMQVALRKDNEVRGVFILESASSFIIQYEDRMMVYRLYPVKISRDRLK
jgi:hypothetical protein